MDAYQRWTLRSRIVLFVGVALVLIPTLDGFKVDLSSAFHEALLLVGVLVTVIGMLDCMGLIGRRKVKEAIREHNAARRRG